jgi:hypothetical protein
MAERASPIRSEGAADEPAALREELLRAQQEAARLRELLVAKDVELGEAKGRVTELEQSSLRLSHLLTFALMFAGRVLDVARAGLRRLRG